MKKALLRSVAVVMIACMLISTIGGFTKNNGGYTEIIIEGVDCCQKEQQLIATLNGEVLISPMNIWCLLGHSMAVGASTVIDHRFWERSPRCRETRFRVDYCTRNNCNHMILTQLSQMPIQCCP